MPPDCYFLIRPTSAIQAGRTQSLAEASAQIAQTLASQPNPQLAKLVSQQRKATRYGTAYAAAAVTQPASTATTG